MGVNQGPTPNAPNTPKPNPAQQTPGTVTVPTPDPSAPYKP